MVRRGSTVRVRQRALQKRRTSALLHGALTFRMRSSTVELAWTITKPIEDSPKDRRNAGLDPGRLGKHAVAALGAVGADGDELEPFVACFEGANGRRADADDVPLPELVHGIVQPDTARSAD